MRGAAKSLATPPAAFTVNITGVSEMVDISIFQFNSRHQGDFSIFFIVSEIIAIIGQNSTLAKMVNFDTLKGCFLKTKLK